MEYKYGTDQYGEPVPDDLVLLDLPVNMQAEEYVEPLFKVDWYQDSEVDALWVSSSAVEKVNRWVAEVLPYDRPEDIGAIFSPDGERVLCKFFLVGRVLRRYSPEDGFYTA